MSGWRTACVLTHWCFSKNYGRWLQTVINFLIIALLMYIIVSAVDGAMKKLKKKEPVPAPAPPPRKCPFCVSVIADEATRCPFCTSQLKEPERI